MSVQEGAGVGCALPVPEEAWREHRSLFLQELVATNRGTMGKCPSAQADEGPPGLAVLETLYLKEAWGNFAAVWCQRCSLRLGLMDSSLAKPLQQMWTSGSLGRRSRSEALGWPLALTGSQVETSRCGSSWCLRYAAVVRRQGLEGEVAWFQIE